MVVIFRPLLQGIGELRTLEERGDRETPELTPESDNGARGIGTSREGITVRTDAAASMET